MPPEDRLPTELTAATHDDASLPEPLRFSLRHLAIALTLIVVFIGLTAQFVRIHAKTVRQDRLRSQILNNVSTIAGALKIRAGVHPIFKQHGGIQAWPPNCPMDSLGQPMNSWRLQLTRELLLADAGDSPEAAIYERWDSPANQRAAYVHGPLFCVIPPYEDTVIFGVTGAGSAFDKSLVSRYDELPPQIIVAMEAADSKTHWMQPGDYDVTQLLASTGMLGNTVKSLLPDRVHVLFADGEVWALSPATPMTTLHPFLTIDAAKSASREQDLSVYRIQTESD